MAKAGDSVPPTEKNGAQVIKTEDEVACAAIDSSAMCTAAAPALSVPSRSEDRSAEPRLQTASSSLPTDSTPDTKANVLFWNTPQCRPAQAYWMVARDRRLRARSARVFGWIQMGAPGS
ncbi:hypothetical protein DFH06DRAFT_1479435 [Mycena polygramma]|nr:hypothetical protein DFH06DRAFT_1479435 [Mycena polygramma]